MSVVAKALCTITVLLGMAVTPAAADLGGLCPTGYSGFVVADLCSRVAWCSDGFLTFHHSCGDGLLFDPSLMTCRSDANYSCPTLSPTFSPTISKGPTDIPTVSPTSSPTQSPSKVPTEAPVTSNPTVSPTSSPTQSPSKAPTEAPVTSNPTASPTSSPTQRPSKAPTEAPVTSNPTVSPTSSPTQRPSKAPVSDAPTAKPSASPVSPTPTDAPVSSSPTSAPVTPNPSSSPVVPTPAPQVPTDVPTSKVTYEPVTAVIQGTRFEVAISGLPTYLFHQSFAELNNILDGMIVSNLQLSVGIEDIQFNTVLVSQGIKKRANRETRAVSPLTDTTFFPSTSILVTRPRPQQYEKDLSNNNLRRRLNEEEGTSVARAMAKGHNRELQREFEGVTLFAIFQKKIYVTVPGTGPSGAYDESLVPTQTELNGAVASVFQEDTQKSLFASWLRASHIQEFNDVEQVDFVGFVDESWTKPDFTKSMKPLVVETHWTAASENEPSI